MVFRKLGPRIIILQQLTGDAVQYISLLLLFAAAYGVYMQSVLNPFYPIDSYGDAFGAFMRIIYKPYFQSYGELMLDDLHDETSCMGTRAKFTDCDSWLDVTIPLVTGIYLIISSIMIINMLIADFTRTFVRTSARGSPGMPPPSLCPPPPARAVVGTASSICNRTPRTAATHKQGSAPVFLY